MDDITTLTQHRPSYILRAGRDNTRLSVKHITPSKVSHIILKSID